MTHGTLGPQWIDDKIGKANAMSEAPERITEDTEYPWGSLASDEEHGMDVIRRSYGWSIMVDGTVAGLVSGDMGYDATHITIPKDHLEAMFDGPGARADLYDAQAKVIEGLINEAVGMADGKDEAEYIEKRLRRTLAALQENSHD